MVLDAHMVLCVTEPDFLKIFFPQIWGGNGPKIGFFEFIGKGLFTLFTVLLTVLFIVFIYRISKK